jgi:hypothetical protein
LIPERPIDILATGLVHIIRPEGEVAAETEDLNSDQRVAVFHTQEAGMETRNGGHQAGLLLPECKLGMHCAGQPNPATRNTNIPGALRRAPGNHVSRIDGNKWTITSRGVNSRFTHQSLDTRHREFLPDFISTRPTEVECSSYDRVTWCY